LELLAYASAAVGKFDDAVFYAGQAAQIADNVNRPTVAADLRKKQDLFRNHQAYTEP